MLTKHQFEILHELEKSTGKKLTQRDICTNVEMSLGTVNTLIKELQSKEYISGYSITDKGYKALEPYRVKNAVIMAAGKSGKFAPLSFEKPNGLMVVKGEVLIEREIKQLKEAGIDDITIVIGYMKQQFFYLEDKYNVKLIINEDYYKYNNTSSIIKVVEQLDNTYLCSADNYFVDNVFEKYVYQSYYAAVYFEGRTEEYCLNYNNKNLITGVTIGGEDAWCMVGQVYFTREFSKKFSEILKQEYDNKETRLQLWERLYMHHIKELKLYIRKYGADKIKEFDSLEELKEFDDKYVSNTDSEMFFNITSTLGCEDRQITDITAIKTGLTNTSFLFSCNGNKYVYRHPSIETNEYINRQSEAFSQEQAKKLNLDNTFIYMDQAKGWKLSKYIEASKVLDYHNADQVKKALEMMRTLHNAKIQSDYDFNICSKTKKIIKRLQSSMQMDYKDFESLYDVIQKLYKYTDKDNAEKCLCHCDCYAPNFLIDKDNNMYLIDWEYSGNDAPASDVGTFICSSDYSYEEALDVIKVYLEHEPSHEELRYYIAYIAISSFYWFVWALYQDSVGKAVGEVIYIWYKYAKLYGNKSLEMYEKENNKLI